MLIHQEPVVPELDLGDDETLLTSRRFIAYVNGQDPGTPCGDPHVTGICTVCLLELV